MTFIDILTIVLVLTLLYYLVYYSVKILNILAISIVNNIARFIERNKENEKWDRIARITDLDS